MEFPIGLFEEPNGWRINTTDYSARRFSTAAYPCHCGALRAALGALAEQDGFLFKKGFKRFVPEPNQKKLKFGHPGINLRNRNGKFEFEIRCRNLSPQTIVISTKLNEQSKGYAQALVRAIKLRKAMELAYKKSYVYDPTKLLVHYTTNCTCNREEAR